MKKLIIVVMLVMFTNVIISSVAPTYNSSSLYAEEDKEGGFFSSITKFLKETMNSVMKGIQDSLQDAVKKVTEFNTTKAMKKLQNKVSDKLVNEMNKSFNNLKAGFSTTNLIGMLKNSVQCSLNTSGIEDKIEDKLNIKLNCSKSDFGLGDWMNKAGEKLDNSIKKHSQNFFKSIGMAKYAKCSGNDNVEEFAEDITMKMQGICEAINKTAHGAIVNTIIAAQSILSPVGSSDRKAYEDGMQAMNELMRIKGKQHSQISLLNEMNKQAESDSTSNGYIASKAAHLIMKCYQRGFINSKNDDTKKIPGNESKTEKDLYKEERAKCNDPLRYYYPNYEDYVNQFQALVQASGWIETTIEVKKDDLSDTEMLREQDKLLALQDFYADDSQKTLTEYKTSLEEVLNRRFEMRRFLESEILFKDKEEALYWNATQAEKMLYATKIVVQLYKDVSLYLEILTDMKKRFGKISISMEKAIAQLNKHSNAKAAYDQAIKKQ